jgi:hypothetical protein
MAITKSGTNQFSGNAWEYFRNDAMSSKNFFAPTKAALNQNQYGGTFGGPVISNKTFFFANYEALRIDTQAMPNRFVTRIIPDRVDPNVALISYSGFNTLTPSTPGHIFRAVYDPVLRRATFSVVDFDLVDIPINTIAFDDVRGDLYAATDFGPLVLPKGATHWETAGLGFPEALMVDLQIAPQQRVLVAATHGLGIFYLQLR